MIVQRSGRVLTREITDDFPNRFGRRPLVGIREVDSCGEVYVGSDLDSGLYEFRHRNYSPTLGRWVQQDPIGYSDGSNLYEAVQSRPITFVDPLGLDGYGQVGGNAPVVSGPAVVGADGTVSVYGPQRPAGPTTRPSGPTTQPGGGPATRPGGATTQPTTQPLPIRIDPSTGAAKVRENVQMELDRISQTKKCKDWCEQLNREGRTVTIRLNSNAKTDSPAAGKSDIINIDPSPTRTGAFVILEGPDGRRYRRQFTLCRKLAHELGHAVTGIGDSGPGRMDNVRENENPVVTELGEDPRAEY